MIPDDSLQYKLGRLQKFFKAAGIAGLALCLLGWWLNRGAFTVGYLIAFLFWFGITLGALPLLCLHNLLKI